MIGKMRGAPVLSHQVKKRSLPQLLEAGCCGADVGVGGCWVLVLGGLMGNVVVNVCNIWE